MGRKSQAETFMPFILVVHTLYNSIQIGMTSSESSLVYSRDMLSAGMRNTNDDMLNMHARD